MISFKNVTKSFGSINALKNVSFEVADGEFVFLTGPSGAGKTTILKMILRDTIPDSGTVTFDNVDVTDISQKEIPQLRQQMGIVFQDFKVLPERTVKENVEVALAVSNVPQEEWEKRVGHILKLVGLSSRSKLFPSQLSGGELQRVSLARALVINPKIILADEPTGNLDWKTAEGIMDLLEQINKEGKTILMATHHEGIIKHAKHRIIHLEDGKITNK
jgi:cell division transport system ATP-binding protein